MLYFLCNNVDSEVTKKDNVYLYPCLFSMKYHSSRYGYLIIISVLIVSIFFRTKNPSNKAKEEKQGWQHWLEVKHKTTKKFK